MPRENRTQVHRQTARPSTALHGFHAAVMRQVMADLSATIQQHDLTPAQLSTLFRLRAQGTLGVSMIANQLGLSSGTASHLVERLIGRALVVRTEHPTDRRGREISLSPDGQAFLEHFDAQLDTALGKLTHGVPDALLERLTGVLDEVLPYLDRGTG